MTKEKSNKETVPEKEKINIILLKNIKENIAVFIENNMNENGDVPYFVKNSLETAFIDIALYMENEGKEFEFKE